MSIPLERPAESAGESCRQTGISYQTSRLAAAYRSMESDICNLERMGAIADRLVGEWIDDVTNVPAAELGNFALQHLTDMLREFKKEYQAA